jgi:hypothetical protein
VNTSLRALTVLALLASPAEAQPSSGPFDLEPGMRLGDVRVGMGHAELAELGLSHQPPGPGRPARYGPYRVVFEAGAVQRVGVRLGQRPVRAGGRVLRSGGTLRDALAAFRHCLHRARGGVECDGNGVRIAPSEEAPGDFEVWVQARRPPLVLSPGAQLGPARIGMTEEQVRALPGVSESSPTLFHVDGVNVHLLEGRVVRLRAGRLGCTRRSPTERPTCRGVSFARRMGFDEEVIVEAHRAR